MKCHRIFSLIILQFFMIGCVALPAQPGDTNAQATACVTQTMEIQATSATAESGNDSVGSNRGTALSGQTGKVESGAGLGTPSPGQIATSQVMEEQSNRDGPPLDQPLGEITPDTQPAGPGLPQPGNSLTPTPTATVSASPTPEEQLMHEESQQPYPGETPSATPCPWFARETTAANPFFS